MSDSLEVLLVSPDYPPPPGGIQTITRNLEYGIKELGHEVSLLHFDPDDYDRDLSDLVPSPRWIHSPRAVLSGEFVYLNAVYRRSKEVIRETQPDIVHAMHIRNWPALVAASEEGIPTVLSTYALEMEEKSLAAVAIQEASTVHSISEFTSSLVREAVPTSPDISLIPPSINVDAYRQGDPSRDSHGPVVALARFVDRKNIQTVVRAWKRLPSEIREERGLVVAGDGPNRKEIESLAEGEDNIEFPGWVQGEEKRELLGKSSLFTLVPKREEYDVEGFGIVYIEAQAAGSPVIGSAHGGAPEAIGDAGLVVDEESDPDVVADAMQTLIEDTDVRNRCLDAADQRIEQFGLLPVARRHVENYRTLLV